MKECDIRLTIPRVPPLQEEDAHGDGKELLVGAAKRGPLLNVTRTLAQYPKLSRDWGRFARHVITETTRPPRERELLILRTGWNCQSGYEFGQHGVWGERPD